MRFIASASPIIPPALRQIDSAPPILALRGREEALQQPAVAIVGSRNASGAGLTFAERLARGLGRAGYVIVSGLARGIDQRAHVASLETGTIAVLAGGHARPYPPEAAPLLGRIAECGAVISEMPVEWEPRGRDFPRRNRIVSGMALGTVIVEAARGSGSLITARFAAEQNREVFAVPGSPLDPRAEGTNDLLRDGANLCARVEDVLNVLDPMRARDPFSICARALRTSAVGTSRASPAAIPPAPRAATRGSAPGSLDLATRGDAGSLHARILELLSPSPISLDELVRVAEAPINEVRIVLLELELAGRLEYSGGARVSLAVPRERDSELAPIRRACADRGEAVKRALQDIGGGHLIDDGGALGARDVLFDQRAVDRGGRQALIPESEGRGVQAAEIAQERARRLHPRAFAAVHVERQADDQREDLMARDLGDQLLRVGGEFLALDGEQRRADAALDIGKREADRLRAEIDADQPRMARQQRRQRFQRDRRGGHSVALTWAARRRHMLQRETARCYRGRDRRSGEPWSEYVRRSGHRPPHRASRAHRGER